MVLCPDSHASNSRPITATRLVNTPKRSIDSSFIFICFSFVGINSCICFTGWERRFNSSSAFVGGRSYFTDPTFSSALANSTENSVFRRPPRVSRYSSHSFCTVANALPVSPLNSSAKFFRPVPHASISLVLPPANVPRTRRPPTWSRPRFFSVAPRSRPAPFCKRARLGQARRIPWQTHQSWLLLAYTLGQRLRGAHLALLYQRHH